MRRCVITQPHRRTSFPFFSPVPVPAPVTVTVPVTVIAVISLHIWQGIRRRSLIEVKPRFRQDGSSNDGTDIHQSLKKSIRTSGCYIALSKPMLTFTCVGICCWGGFVLFFGAAAKEKEEMFVMTMVQCIACRSLVMLCCRAMVSTVCQGMSKDRMLRTILPSPPSTHSLARP